jgi:hypothetical protein
MQNYGILHLGKNEDNGCGTIEAARTKYHFKEFNLIINSILGQSRDAFCGRGILQETYQYSIEF